MARKKPFSALKDVDDIMHVLIGKRIKDILPRAIEIFGEDVIKGLMRETGVRLPPDNPYTILEVRPDASDLVIKAVYRAKARVYHPDNRETGNDDMFKRITAAYEKIMVDRHGSSKA
jgi:hypothetical protein